MTNQPPRIFKRVSDTGLAVSADGLVMDVASRQIILSRFVKKRGKVYRRVRYNGRYFFVHQLVAQAWLGDTQGRTVVFLDGNTANVDASNLAWGASGGRPRLPLPTHPERKSYRQLAERFQISISTAYRRFKWHKSE